MKNFLMIVEAHIKDPSQQHNYLEDVAYVPLSLESQEATSTEMMRRDQEPISSNVIEMSSARPTSNDEDQHISG